MKTSKLAFAISSITIAVLLIVGQRSLAKTKDNTYWYRSRTLGLTTISADMSCTGEGEQCTVVTATILPSQSHKLYLDAALTIPADHV